jgi:phosphatidylglycerol lysyltransferase
MTQTPGKTGTAIGRTAALVRRVPVTSAALLVILLVGVTTGTLWSPLVDRAWFPAVGYGVPAFEAGRWWTLLTGAFFALTPAYYLPVVAAVALLVGACEWRLGSARAAVICAGGQLVAVLGATATVLAFRHSGWAWAGGLSASLDVGLSGGALACGAAVAAAVRPPWRLRLVAGLFVYVGVSALFVGSLADVEHLWAVAVALLLGRRLAGRHAVPGPLWAGHRTRQLLAVTGLVLIAVAEVVLRLVPSDGPLGSTREVDGSAWGTVLTVVVVGLVVNGLRKGRRAAWWTAVALCALNLAARVVAGVGAPGGTALPIAAAALWAAELAVLVVFRRSFRARRRSTTSDDAGVVALLERHGGGTLSWMSTWPANSHFRTPDGRSVIAFQRHAGVAVALGDPIGPPDGRAAAVHAFAAMCERGGLVPCLFSVTAGTAEVTGRLGWQHVQVAEDALIDLDGLQFRGKRWQDVRSALNRAARDGIGYREVALADEPWAIRAQVRAISQGWVGDRSLPELGFTVGGIEEALDPGVRVGMAVDADGSVHGVTSWLPVHGPGGTVDGWTLDVMRRRQDGFRPVIEFLIASAVTAFGAQGARFVSLSGAPLAHSPAPRHNPAVARLLDTLGAALEPLYGFRSLHAYKAKFGPRYEPMHLVYRDEGDLPRIGIALTRAYLPGSGIRDVMGLARARGR